MTKALGILAVVGIAGVRAVSADASSAQLSVGVTVVRSCAVDARPADKASSLRLTCTAGAKSHLRLSESVQRPAATVASDDLHLITLNF